MEIQWKRYEVEWTFNERLCGSVPMKRELVRPWLESRMETVPEEIEEEVIESLDEEQEKVTLGFQKDKAGLFVRGGTIKAHIKDCANQIKDCLGIKNLRSKVANAVYLEEYKVYIWRPGIDGPLEDAILQEVDGVFDQPVHVITARGRRNALKTISYVQGVKLIFNVKMLPSKEVDEKVLRGVFEYGSMHGYGGERGLGEGRYRFQMEEMGKFGTSGSEAETRGDMR